MNPICRIDINRPECQQWMDDVFKQCRQIFSRELASSDWWQDETPAIYRSDVHDMTALDCHRLKRDLAREVAATGAGGHFLWWHKVLLVAAYLVIFGALVFLCRWVDGNSCRHVKIEPMPEAIEPEEAPPTPTDSPKQRKKRKRTIKNWLRRRCRHLFVHSEVELRRQKSKREREEKVHEEHTQRKIEKWTHAREQEEQKRRERQRGREDKIQSQNS